MTQNEEIAQDSAPSLPATCRRHAVADRPRWMSHHCRRRRLPHGSVYEDNAHADVATRGGRRLQSFYAQWIQKDFARWRESGITRARTFVVQSAIASMLCSDIATQCAVWDRRLLRAPVSSIVCLLSPPGAVRWK